MATTRESKSEDEWGKDGGKLNMKEPSMWVKLGFKERFF